MMLRDKTVFGADADAFRPERFLENELRDPRKAIFGFGRR
jgi:cytochrome P450